MRCCRYCLRPPQQIEVLIWATLLLTIPGVALAIGFNALFAIAVPIEWRGYVAGRRNALLSVVYIIASLLAGVILNRTSLEVGYTLIFAVGFVGAAMSTYHRPGCAPSPICRETNRSVSARSSATRRNPAKCAAGRASASASRSPCAPLRGARTCCALMCCAAILVW